MKTYMIRAARKAFAAGNHNVTVIGAPGRWNSFLVIIEDDKTTKAQAIAIIDGLKLSLHARITTRSERIASKEIRNA